MEAYGAGDLAEAAKNFLAVLEICPDHSDALSNAGACFNALHRYEEAWRLLSRALTLDPKDVGALNNMGLVLGNLHRQKDALACFRRALEIGGLRADVLSNLGSCLSALNRLDEALKCFDQALKLAPQADEIRFARSFPLLALGQLAPGFQDYESRWRVPPLNRFVFQSSAPIWHGQMAIEGSTVLLHHEQGLGDMIQFVRFANDLTQKGASVILLVPATLKRLFQSLRGGMQVFAPGDRLPAHQWCVPLLSLPLLLGLQRPEDVVRPAYLSASVDSQQAWATRLGPRKRPRVGLLWRGNPNNSDSHRRDVPVATLAPLRELNVDLIGLQQQLTNAETAALAAFPNFTLLGDQCSDLADLAALISELDAGISVDSAVAHLAGALGKPVWILLRHSPCWRWFRDRSNSPWYESASLIHQPSEGDWASVVSQTALLVDRAFSSSST